MLHRVTGHLRRQWIGVVALFVALGGTSYAAVELPHNSVGTAQLRAGSVTPSKLSGSSFGGHILYTANIALGGHVTSSDPKGATTSDWLSQLGSFSQGEVRWHRAIAADCFAVASSQGAGPAPPAGVPVSSPEVVAGSSRRAMVNIAMSYDGPVSVAVICPD